MTTKIKLLSGFVLAVLFCACTNERSRAFGSDTDNHNQGTPAAHATEHHEADTLHKAQSREIKGSESYNYGEQPSK